MLSGVHVPLITPFDGGQIDFNSHDRLVDHLLDANPNGLVMFGTTGERLLISDQEAVALAKRTISAVSAALPLTLAVGAVSTQEVMNQVRLFEDLEPAAYLVGSPFYVRPSQEDLIRHHATVATATERPVLLYNIPFRSGVNLTNESVLELATIDNVMGIKDVCGDLEQTFELLRLKPDNFTVLAGQDPHYLASLAHGADGGVLASAHFRTFDFCHMTELLRGGALLDGRRIWVEKLQHLVEVLFEEPSPLSIKWMMWRLGVIASPECRPPLTQVPDHRTAHLEEAARILTNIIRHPLA
ncbi:MAG: dihydrodipicolinate synthase family protein [Pseudonocardiaceae bacterium]